MPALKGEKKTVKKKVILKPEIKEPELEPIPDRLESGVQLLLDQMPDYVDQLVTDIAAQAVIPKWQLLGGILFEAYNNGYLSSYTLDPAWKDGFKLVESVCGFCHGTYKPVRIGQLFCCNECGQGRPKIGEEEHAKKVALEKKGKESKVGEDNTILSDLDKLIINNTTTNKATKITPASGSGWTEGTIGE